MATKISRKKIIAEVRSTFETNGSSARAKKESSYFRGVVSFHGLCAKDIRDLVARPLYTSRVRSLTLRNKLLLCYELIDTEYGDEKFVAVEWLSKFVAPILRQGKAAVNDFLDEMEGVIDAHVYDWATADRLASRVFGELIKAEVKAGSLQSDSEESSLDEETEGETEDDSSSLVAARLRSWRHSSCLWRQRIACVSFLKFPRNRSLGVFDNTIVAIALTCVRNPERFVQLGTGWILRELSTVDLDRVVRFIKENYVHFSREGLRYAIEKMEPDLRRELMEFGRTTPSERSFSTVRGKRVRRRAPESESDDDDDDDDEWSPPRKRRRRTRK